MALPVKIHPEFETKEQTSFDEIANVFAVTDLSSLNHLLEYISAHDLDIQFVLKRSADNIGLKVDDRVSDRAYDRAYDRVVEIINDRVSDRAIDRAIDRAVDRVSDRASDRVYDKAGDRVGNTVKTILDTCTNPKTRTDVLNAIGLKNYIGNYRGYMLPLIEIDWLEKTEKETSPRQRYRTTRKGKILLKLLDELEEMI